MTSLRDSYNNLVTKGHQFDPHQFELVCLLDEHRKKIISKNYIAKLLKKKTNPKGFYIWGGVGRGKSLIADLFYQSIETPYKQKLHFHSFMLSFHKAFKAIGEQHNLLSSAALIKKAVNLILPKCKLLFLDELQINNIADAMIMERLFKVISRNDIFTVITSNRPAGDLFLDGLNRERFLPFITMITNEFINYNLNGPTDYRYEQTISMEKMYFHPINDFTIAEMNNSIKHLFEFEKIHEQTLQVYKERSIKIERCCNSTAFFSFAELCDAPLGAADYNAICHHFKNIVITSIPQLVGDDHNQALRFITLVDCLYDNKTRLICSAAVSIDELYSGSKNRFEFARTISRLHEMQSKAYLSSQYHDKMDIDLSNT